MSDLMLETAYTTLDENKIEYTVSLVSDFAKKYSISTVQAFNYLDRFKAVKLVNNHYDIMHTLPYSQVLDDLSEYCRSNGGNL